MALRIPCLCGIVFCLVFSSGCARPSGALEETTQSVYPFPRDGIFSIDHIDGSIHVYGWKEPRLKIVALRKAYTAARLHQIRVEIDARPGSVAMRTRIPPATGIFTDRSGTIDYTIVLPETARLRKLHVRSGEVVLENLRGGAATAEVENGKITALNCFADVRARATNGALEMFFDWSEELSARFDYTIGYGTIWAKLPRDARFSIEATAGGNITNQFGLAGKRKLANGQTSLAASTAAAPTMSLVLRNQKGNISIDAAPAGTR